MDFALSETERRIRDTGRRVAEEVVAPTVQERLENHGTSPETMLALGRAGLLAINIPEGLGGQAAGPVALAAAIREVATADASVAVTMSVSNMVGEVITAFGTEAQARAHVPRIASGEYFGGAFALSEPGAGSDAAALSTRAEHKDGRWVLNGQKMWISHGDDSGVLVVWARTGDAGHKGISCFLVEKGTPGLVSDKPEEKMGLWGSHTVALSLDDVEVGDDAMLGHEGDGFKLAMVALDGGRIGIGSQAGGIGRAALRASRRYVQEHERQKSQAFQFGLADMATELDAAWLLTLRAAFLKGQKVRFSQMAAMAKVFSAEAANRAVRAAVQICGPDGIRGEVARLFRDCRVTEIYEGTSEVQRLVIGRGVLSEARG